MEKSKSVFRGLFFGNAESVDFNVFQFKLESVLDSFLVWHLNSCPDHENCRNTCTHFWGIHNSLSAAVEKSREELFSVETELATEVGKMFLLSLISKEIFDILSKIDNLGYSDNKVKDLIGDLSLYASFF